MKAFFLSLVSAALLLVIMPGAVVAQPPDAWTDTLAEQYSVSADVVYRTANNIPLTLDVYQRRGRKKNPAVVWFHGGGWVTGDKNGNFVRFLPFMRMGYTVVSVNYRLAKQAPAPAAVDDARYALRWVVSRSERFNIDPDRIVLSGTSAGAHLALMAAMIPESAGLDHAPGSDAALAVSVADWWTSGALTQLRPAAVVDFWGITDVDDLIAGANARSWAMDWVGDTTNRALAVKVSPMAHVRAGLPPVLMIHGDPDPLVPFAQSQRLGEALDKAGVKNKLVRFPGGGHGDFSTDDMHRAWNEVRAFLGECKALPD
ncbi:alpha/beta hydrolase [Candidatus Sumerlaeota bacterium]|nr:alpha/beta hydrolase [Candidatus Sumerlaeota bacterium]